MQELTALLDATTPGTWLLMKNEDSISVVAQTDPEGAAPGVADARARRGTGGQREGVVDQGAHRRTSLGGRWDTRLSVRDLR